MGAVHRAAHRRSVHRAADQPRIRRRGRAVLESPLFVVHVISMLFAYAAFALASVVSITYVLLFRELKRKQPGVFFARLPSLRALDQMNLRAVVVGLVFLTIGVGVGVLWAAQARALCAGRPARAGDVARPIRRS